MDEPKIAIPALAPWAATACLAALLACVGELWMIERARNRLMHDQGLLGEAALKAAQNQLEAERILNRREIAELSEGTPWDSGLSVALLAPPAGITPGPGAPPWGVVVTAASGRRALLRVSGLPEAGAGRAYRIWLEGTGSPYPANCGLLSAATATTRATPVELGAPAVPGCRFVLVNAPAGEDRGPGLPGSADVIVLASPRLPGKIAN
jgi:hypothetical protein